MAFDLGNGIWSGVFAVPNIITDMHIKMASGLSMKALLLLLRHGGRLEIAELASILGQSVCDVQDAVNYWVGHGILAPAGQEPKTEVTAAPPALSYEELPDPAAFESPAPSEPPEPPEQAESHRVKTLSSSRPRLTTGEINEMADKDENVACLLQEAQSVLGKPLTPVDSSIMATLYSYNKMQPDLILMLVHYCVSIGKSSMRYIIKVADDWDDKGINTHEKAEAEILRLTKLNQMESKVKTALSIYDRDLISTEKKYVHTWVEDMGMDPSLIGLAYERSVELKGKRSFAYMNAILKSWYEKGIKTPAGAMGEIGKGKHKDKPTAGAAGSSYDMGELEKLITDGGM